MSRYTIEYSRERGPQGASGSTDASAITSGTLNAARLPATVVQTTGTYANPAWITELASTKITGTLTKLQQHAQTAYYDQAGTFTQALSTKNISADGVVYANRFSTNGNDTHIGHEDGNNYLGGITYFRPAVGGSSGALIAGNGQAWVSTLSVGGGLETTPPTNGLLVQGAATFNGNLQANGSENFIGGIANIGSTDIYRVGRFRTATGGDIDFGLLGGSTIGIQSLDSGGNFQTLRLQPNGGALSVGGAATFNGNTRVNGNHLVKGDLDLYDTVQDGASWWKFSQVGVAAGGLQLYSQNTGRGVVFQPLGGMDIDSGTSNAVALRVKEVGEIKFVVTSGGNVTAGALTASGYALFEGIANVLGGLYAKPFVDIRGTDYTTRAFINGETGAATFNGSVKIGTKTIATLPSAASSVGERYQVSDSATIANRIAFSNGSAWYYEGTAVAV